MLTIAVIAFREFLEAFLIIGVFLGISKKLGLKKEKEISLAAAVGIILSFVLAIAAFLLDERARTILTENNADIVESYLLIFSGIFIAYVVLSLHKTLSKQRNELIWKANQKLEQNIFDVSLFLTIVFMIVREGFEIALFTAGTSLFSVFMQNFIGLFLGFFLSVLVGSVVFFAYIQFSIGKVFRITEYIIVILGASLIQNGITKLFETHFAVNFSRIIPLPLLFLPSEDSLPGHVLQSLLGIDREFSMFRLFIMAAYIAIVYLFYLKRNTYPTKSEVTNH